MGELYIGIDISKEQSTAQGLNAKGEKLFYLEFPMNRKRFSDLMK